MNEPAEILAAVAASLALVVIIADVDVLAVPLGLLLIGGLVLGRRAGGLRPSRHGPPARSYHRPETSILIGEGSSP